MTANGVIQILVFFGIVFALTKPLGLYMTRVFQRERTLLDRVLVPIERLIYRLSGVKPDVEQHWTTYTIAMLLFNVTGLVVLYAMQRLQHLMPLNPQSLGPISADSSFNTAVSFTSNTNWQSYVPESTMSYFTQMAGLTFHNFVSAATGIALAIALVRGFARHEMKTVGNFWVDLTRSTLWILLPICLLVAPVLVWQGVPQNLNPYTVAKTVEGADQTIAQGPVASQEVIKELGTNGGGFFNANSSHPYENPTPLTDLIEMVLIFAISAGLTYTFGAMVGDTRQGWALFAVMAALFLAGVSVSYWSEASGNPAFARMGIDPSGGNMEGKEIRFGVANSALWATVTTDTSCGAVNSMHDSFTPLGGMIPMINIQLGEVVYGGVGSGLYGMLVFAVLSVFIAGLMVGRTPEYLGKKIEAKEVTLAVLAILVLEFSILGFTAVASVTTAGLAGPLNKGPHGFSEILYAYSEGAGNNGSAFAGISANTVFYNLTIGLAMLFGRFLMIVPTIAIAGSLVKKKLVPASSGTFPTTGPLFVALVVGVILIVGGLTFFPALALGPIVDHLYMLAGKPL